MTRPVIGILGNILETRSSVSGSIVNRNFTNDTCVRSVANNGGAPIVLPFTNDPEAQEAAFALCDGMLFPGGGDVDPSYYGEEPHPKLGEMDHDIDEFWFRAVRYARGHRVAMLGICRGIQVLNVAWGGTLYQDLGSQRPGSLEHIQRELRHLTTQTARIEPGTRLRDILGEDVVPTNTMHHQAVKDPAEGLIVSAHAEDGVIEGLESPDGLVIAVQWHPEDLIESTPVMNKLFQDLTARAEAHASARK